MPSNTIDQSSIPTPFIQARPTLPHPFHSDTSLLRCFSLFVPETLQPSINADLTRFGELVLSPEQISHMHSSGAVLPSINHYDTFGRRVDTLHTSEGWRASTRIAAREGLVALGYEKATYGAYARTYQFLKMHLWSASSCGVTCPSAMQDGAASLLLRHVDGKEKSTPDATKAVLRSALSRLLSRDPDRAWTSGQWMTERPGGSDVSRTETWARKLDESDASNAEAEMCGSDGSPLGPWSIQGYKWFSSATDADMTVMLAKTPGAMSGPDSGRVSAFFAPLKVRRTGGTLAGAVHSGASEQLSYNNLSIPRLKSKLGTHSLPTSEISLNGTRAYLIGELGRGTKEISAILNITRIHTAVGGLGGWARGIAISKAYATVREVGKGRLLKNIPAHVKGLAEKEVEYRAAMLFCYFSVALLGIVEYNSSSASSQCEGARTFLPSTSPERAQQLLRLLTPVLKSSAALSSINGLRFCMESLGGVGYLENQDPELNIARIFRDTCVLSIWEGTTDVLAADTARVLKGKEGEQVAATFTTWVDEAVTRWKDRVEERYRESVTRESQTWVQLVKENGKEALLYRGREVMDGIQWLVSAVLLFEDALRDNDPISWEIAKRWASKRVDRKDSEPMKQDWRDEFEWDHRLVFGSDVGTAIARL